MRHDAQMMTHPTRLSLALLLMALPWAPLQAQTQPPSPVSAEDRASISNCLRESPSTPQACVGSIAVVCARTTTGQDRRDTEITCARREAAIWRERLDAGQLGYAQQLQPAARSRFIALQRSWESYTAQKCAFFGEIQPVARAAVMQAGCDLREVANRAIEIERNLRQRSATPGQLQRNQPPSIVR
jgi:Lysozyme inhibitor LprI